jgi:hemerythrin-like domain-containing protein
VTDAGAHLVEIHDYFRSRLALLRDEVRAVADGRLDPAVARASVQAMTPSDARIGALCAQYCALLTAHHGHEDHGLFPAMRAFEPSLGPAIDRLEREHLVVHGLLVDIDRALVAFTTGPDGVAALQRSLDALSEALLAHLAYEEEQLVEPLSRYGFG